MAKICIKFCKYMKLHRWCGYIYCKRTLQHLEKYRNGFMRLPACLAAEVKDYGDSGWMDIYSGVKFTKKELKVLNDKFKKLKEAQERNRK